VLKKKVLVLGSTGLIGHQVYKYLYDKGFYEMYNISYRTKLTSDSIIQNVRDEAKLIERITKIAPDYIINCVGVLIEGSNKNHENAIFLNSYLPHRLSRLADQIFSKLIHISTDCIFSGRKGCAYIETDIPDGEGVYARTKALGEFNNNHHLILRTSVVGPELKEDGEELFHWFMGQSGKISGFTQTIWSGVSSFELAKAVNWSIRNNVTGLYHVTNNLSISKYEILELFKKHTNKDIQIEAVDGNNLNKSFKDTRMLIDYEIPSYDQMILEMIISIKKRKSTYLHYNLNSFAKP
jgi:dTDP-4-dehydrorhamnose reductase